MFYGSNSATDLNHVSDINIWGNMILLYTFTYSGNWTPSMGYILLTTSYYFRYYHLLSNNYGGHCNITNFSIQYGKNGSLVNGIDYTISTSSTNGSPVITCIDVSPQGILYNLDRLLVSEAYRRIYPVIYDTNNLYLSGNTGWNISSNSNSTNLCFNYNSSNKCYHEITGNTYITGDLYRSVTSLTSTLSNLASQNNPIFGGSNLYFLTTSNGGWNIAYSSSSFGISLNNVIQALSLDNAGLITIPQGISGYSTTNQVNSLITNSLTKYTTSSNLASNYVSNTSLSNTISNILIL